MSDWRNRLTADEEKELAKLYVWRDEIRIEAAHNRKRIKAIMNRAIQRAMAARKKSTAHPIKGVDTVAEAH